MNSVKPIDNNNNMRDDFKRVRAVQNKCLDEEENMSNGKKVWRWIKTFVAGSIAIPMCCCCFCFGCCGKMKGPGTMVKYDDDDYNTLGDADKRSVHMADWAMTSHTTCTCVPMCCGCFCGGCGIIGPRQGYELASGTTRRR